MSRQQHKDPNDRRDGAYFGERTGSGQQKRDRDEEFRRMDDYHMSIDPGDHFITGNLHIHQEDLRRAMDDPEFFFRMFGHPKDGDLARYAQRLRDMMMRGQPPGFNSPARNEEIPEELAPEVLREMLHRYGMERVFDALVNTITEMGDLASVLMVMRADMETRRETVEFRGDYRWEP